MDKKIHYFETHTDYSNYEKSLATTPHVSYTEEDDLVRYNEDLDISRMPLTFEFIDSGIFSYNRTFYYSYYYYIYCTFKHIRDGEVINTITTRDTISFDVIKDDKITVEYSSSETSSTGYYSSSSYYYRFSSTAKCYAYGNIMSLTSGGVDSKTISTAYMFRSLFYGFSNLLSHPVNKLYLPATTLSEYCYYCMFQNCSSLTRAPELPAITLTNYCYYYMFSGCTELNEVKAAFTTIGSNSLYYWLNLVSSTGTFYKNNLATWTTVGVSGIPNGWIVKRYTV